DGEHGAEHGGPESESIDQRRRLLGGDDRHDHTLSPRRPIAAPARSALRRERSREPVGITQRLSIACVVGDAPQGGPFVTKTFVAVLIAAALLTGCAGEAKGPSATA